MRQWQDSSGAVMGLLDFQVNKVEGRPSIAFAKYGVALTGHVYYVDVYEYRLASDPTQAALFLLCHDNRDGRVTDIQIERVNDDVFVNFVRLTTDPNTSKRILNSYSYRYDSKSGFSRTTEDFY
jgi:hypothetical protein